MAKLSPLDKYYPSSTNSDKITDKTGDSSVESVKNKYNNQNNNNNGDNSLVSDISNDEKKSAQSNTPVDLSESGQEKQKKVTATLGKYIGGLGGTQPLISINDYYFNSREIIKFEINTFFWEPRCTLTVELHGGIFLTRHFPKDGDIISVFIRSYKNDFKPIRNDYLIQKVVSSKSTDVEGSEIRITFYGILRVPKMYFEICKGIKEKTSYESLLDMATELDLGFVSNEVDIMLDKMNWICGWQTYAEFIQHITSRSYKDEYSFYDSWIDYYYNLNFLNVNKVLSVSDNEPAKDGLHRGSWTLDHGLSDFTHHEKGKLLLTNAKEYVSTNSFFNSIRIYNDSGNISSINGYKRHIYFYDFNNEELVDFDIESLTTEGAEKNKVILKGRQGEDYYKNQTKRKWLGIQYSLEDHNVHQHYKESYIQNFQNLLELNRLTLIVSLPQTNFNLYKGQRIPLIFVLQDDPNRIKVAGNLEDKARTIGFSLDRFLTGNYYIKGIKFVYNQDDESEYERGLVKGTWQQEVLLTRREWPMPDSPKVSVEDDPSNWVKTQPL